MSTVTVKKLRSPLNARLRLPASKSLTVRDFVFAALAQGTSLLKDPGTGDDCQVIQTALKTLGIKISARKSAAKNSLREIEVIGRGGRFASGVKKIFLGGSGISTRFLLALALLRPEPTHFSGDQSLSCRPQQPLLDALQSLGARVQAAPGGCLPITIQGPDPAALAFRTPVVTIPGDQSSQYLSALLGIAPLLPRGLKLIVKGRLVSEPYLDITLNELQQFKIRVKKTRSKANKSANSRNNTKAARLTFQIPSQKYQPARLTIEGDASAASYFMALAAIHGGTVHFKNLGRNSRQGDLQFHQIMRQLGASVRLTDSTLAVTGPGRGALKALTRPIDLTNLPDVAPTLMAIAPLIPGRTKITGLGTLRHKECDRLFACVQELKKLKVPLKSGADWIEIAEKNDYSDVDLAKISIDTYNDHRMAMSFAVLGTKIGPLTINDPACVNKTYPEFWKDLRRMMVNG